MSRGVYTVRDLWAEWHDGLSGQPSVEYLENNFGRKWRLSAKEAKFFSRRLVVIKYVRSLISRGLQLDNALEKAEIERGRKSIDAFSKHLLVRLIA